jgi:hypothetical protein
MRSNSVKGGVKPDQWGGVKLDHRVSGKLLGMRGVWRPELSGRRHTPQGELAAIHRFNPGLACIITTVENAKSWFDAQPENTDADSTSAPETGKCLPMGLTPKPGKT